jgi:hypothetical protein
MYTVFPLYFRFKNGVLFLLLLLLWKLRGIHIQN